MYSVLSVQHTGTRYLIHKLDVGRNSEHTYKGNQKRVDKLLGMPYLIVVPLRHPARVYESWVRRERRLHELDYQYEYMAKITSKRDVYFVSVENGDAPIGSNANTANMEITPAMQKRVPDEVMRWYEDAMAKAVPLDTLL